MYKKGARKEYYICQQLKAEDYDIVQRTAGSHSPIDIIALKKSEKIIKLIQSKRTMKNNMQYIDPKLKKKLEKEHEDLNGEYTVIFEAR